MSTREELEKFMTPAGRARVDQFVAEASDEDDDVDMDEVIRQNLADHEAALTGKQSEPDDDWAALWRRICHVATDQPHVQPDMEPERFVRILSREKRPSALDVALIADAFGVTVAWLLTGDDHGMCEGTIAALQDEIRLCTERIRALEADLPKLVSICCHQAYGAPHAMACREYSGPIDHWRVYSISDMADLTARGLAECTCGARYLVAGGACPNSAETWRGSKPDGAP